MPRSKAIPANGIEQITAAAGPLFDNANKLLDNGYVMVSDRRCDLSDLGRNFLPRADALKTDADNMQNVMTNIDGLAKGADSVLGTADKFISTTDKGASGTAETTARHAFESESGHHIR